MSVEYKAKIRLTTIIPYHTQFVGVNNEDLGEIKYINMMQHFTRTKSTFCVNRTKKKHKSTKSNQCTKFGAVTYDVWQI